MTHRKLLGKIPRLCPIGGGTRYKTGSLESCVFRLVSIIIHRGNGGRTPTDIGTQPLDGDRSTDVCDIGPQPLDGNRPTGNKITDYDTGQSCTQSFSSYSCTYPVCEPLKYRI